MGSIGTADVVVTLSIPNVFSSPQQIQGFATDEVLDIPQIRSSETLMGVDGVLSVGFVFVPIIWTISLQADSVSNDIFDTWWAQSQATLTSYPASGLIKIPQIGMKYTLAGGILTGYKPLSNLKRLAQPRTFEITCQSIAPAPA